MWGRPPVPAPAGGGGVGRDPRGAVERGPGAGGACGGRPRHRRALRGAPSRWPGGATPGAVPLRGALPGLPPVPAVSPRP